MKIPKKVNAMNLRQQEQWLIEKLKETHAQEDEIKRMLAQVRQGYRYEVSEIDRPDLITLKGE